MFNALGVVSSVFNATLVFSCMVDSRQTGSQSHYVLRQMNVLRFSLDALLFTSVASEVSLSTSYHRVCSEIYKCLHSSVLYHIINIIENKF